MCPVRSPANVDASTVVPVAPVAGDAGASPCPRRTGWQVTGGAWRAVADAVTAEAALEVRLNGRSFTVTMRTPGADRELVRGLLLAEGVLGREGFTAAAFACDVVEREADGTTRTVDVRLPPLMLCEQLFDRRSLTATASCGLCGQRRLDDLPDNLQPLRDRAEHADPGSVGRRFDPARLADCFATMGRAQEAFRASGGCHAAAAFDVHGDCLAVHEDVGRHNAVDKVLGALALAGTLDAAHLLTVSGRVSYEIILKAWRGGVPLLAAVSAPSSLAVDTATAAGLTLLGFCRGDRATVYTHPERLAGCATHPAS